MELFYLTIEMKFLGRNFTKTYIVFYIFLSCSASWVTINGVTYSIGLVVIVSSCLVPIFGEIVDIIVYDTDNYLLVTRSLFTVAFVSHYHAYEVMHPESDEFSVLKQVQLPDSTPLSLYSLKNHSNYYVILKHHIPESI